MQKQGAPDTRGNLTTIIIIICWGKRKLHLHRKPSDPRGFFFFFPNVALYDFNARALTVSTLFRFSAGPEESQRHLKPEKARAPRQRRRWRARRWVRRWTRVCAHPRPVTHAPAVGAVSRPPSAFPTLRFSHPNTEVAYRFFFFPLWVKETRTGASGHIYAGDIIRTTASGI